MKKIQLFSNSTAHSGVITLEDGWGFSFQLEHFLFYNKYTVKVNKSIFKLCYEGCYEASRHRYPRRLGLNNLFLVFCRKISRILEMKTKGFLSKLARDCFNIFLQVKLKYIFHFRSK